MATGKTCSVGCKLPNGLIIELDYKSVPGGIVKGDKYVEIELKGANQHSIIRGINRDPAPKDLQPGITDGVDEEAFDKWMATHADTKLVKHKLVFKANNRRDAEAIAKEMTPEKMGLEPIDPTKVQGIAPVPKED